MSLILLEQPACEPINLLETKIFLRLEGAEEDEILKNLIKTARQAVEAYTARSLICQSWRFRINLAYCLSISDDLYLTGQKSRGSKGLEIPRSPFIKLLDKPKLINDYGSREISGYRLDTAGRVAKMHFSNLQTNAFHSQSLIQIDFSAGYGDTVKDVPDPLRQAILMMVADLYEKRVGVNDNKGFPPVLSPGALELVKPYRVSRLA
jgi:hypothetical protein